MTFFIHCKNSLNWFVYNKKLAFHQYLDNWTAASLECDYQGTIKLWFTISRSMLSLLELIKATTACFIIKSRTKTGQCFPYFRKTELNNESHVRNLTWTVRDLTFLLPHKCGLWWWQVFEPLSLISWPLAETYFTVCAHVFIKCCFLLYLNVHLFH